ncbi:hypothetical protein [Cohnella lupini]|uniref:ABC-2 family transporter n=1 Tax=Cohnella lupini TaxID=1294267 RepID=A0A3D9IXH3_9BACL|nr:hypothetical protein [Cohnella lupini]RED66307.1 hypothetical protein DFP95_101806 [Cohnella lupini]
MSHYLKLVHMEIHRFRYPLAAMMGLTLVWQMVTLIIHVNGKLDRAADALIHNLLVNGAALERFSFADMIPGMLYSLPILACIAALSVYVFLIWYRDWYGRVSFIYRLLMLPASRKHVYLAKLTAIVLLVLGMLSFQLLLLPVEQWVFKLIVPAEHFEASTFGDVVSANLVLDVLLPRNFDRFALSYLLGIAAVIVIFTAILLERSYRLAGILYAVGYASICTFVFLYTMYLMWTGSYLYPEEIIAIEFAIGILITAVSIWLGFRLLKKKITV